MSLRDGNHRLAQAYEELLRRSRGLTLIEMGIPLLRIAAELRAASSLKTPDALQLATAIQAKCRCFLTHDRRLPKVPGLEIIQVANLL